MINKLTAVPINIAEIMAIESGFCSSLPISNVKSSGTIPKMVVSDVMMIGRSRRRPASWMASSNGTPALRSSLIASNFRMESLMMIPHVTTMPMALIRFSVCPQSHNTNRAAATSMGISNKTINGCRKLSNWAAKMKYISSMEMKRMITN